MATYEEKLASRLVASKSLPRGRRLEFLKVMRALKGIDPVTILVWMQVILALLEAAGPLLKKVKDLLEAMRKKESPTAFAKRKGISL